MSEYTSPIPTRARRPRRELSPVTQKVHQQGMRLYEGFCETHHYQPHPADIHVVMSWMDWLYTQPGKLNRPLAPKTVECYLRAVKLYQIERREEDPKWPTLDSELLRERLAAYRWQYEADGHRPPEQPEFGPGHLLAMLGWLRRDRCQGRRDAAVFAVLFGATARREEVAGLRVEDVSSVDGGLRLWFASSGRAAFVEPHPADAARCPVRAVEEYVEDLERHGVVSGPLIAHMASPSVWPSQWVGMGPQGVYQLVLSRSLAAGLGHQTPESVRAGSARAVAAATEGDLLAVTDAGGWVTTDGVRRFVEQRREHASVLGAAYGAAELVPVVEQEG